MRYEAEGGRGSCLISLGGKMEPVKSSKHSNGFHGHYFYQRYVPYFMQ